MQTNNIKKIIDVDLLCIKTDPPQYNVIYINDKDELVKGLIKGVDVWNFYQSNNILEEMDYNTFKHFSFYCNDNKLKETVSTKIIEKLKSENKGIVKDSNIIKMMCLKHQKPNITFTKRFMPTSPRLVTQLVKLDFDRKLNLYTCKYKNNKNKNYFFKFIKMIDDNDNIIDEYKIDIVKFKHNDEEITTWYGQALLKNENFEMKNLYPFYLSDYQFEINTEFKIKEIYLYLCYEEISIPSSLYIENNFLDEDNIILYSNYINGEITIGNVDGYYKEVRVFLVDSILGKKIDIDVIKRISINGILDDVPTSLLKKDNNILIFENGYNIIEHNLSSGFILSKNNVFKFEFSNKLEKMKFSNITLCVVGKKYVYHKTSTITNDFQETSLMPNDNHI